MKKKRTMALLLAVFLLVPLLVLPSSAKYRYEDADDWGDPTEEHWAMPAIRKARDEGYTFQNLFDRRGRMFVAPDDALTCGQFVEMVVRALLPDRLSSEQGTTWAERMQNAAQDAGILEGTNLAQPKATQRPITRYDAAVLITNALARLQVGAEDLTAAQGMIGDFKSIPEGYRPAVANLYALELVAGKDKQGRYCGAEYITLAESCVLVNRARKCVEQTFFAYDIEYTFWEDTAEGRRLFTGLWVKGIPLPESEAEKTAPDLEDPARSHPEGYWWQMIWPGLEIDFYHHRESVDAVYGIRVTRPGLSTFQGICVGSALEELLAAYQDTGQTLEYDPGCYKYIPNEYAGSYYPFLVFSVEDGILTEISTLFHIRNFNYDD